MTDMADYDIDAELESWMDKVAADNGMDRNQLAQQELEVWSRWKQNPNTEDFHWLYNSHQKVIQSAGQRYLSSTTLPKAAVRSDMLRNYITALSGYNPAKEAKLSTWIHRNMGHTGRYLQKYQNMAKIPVNRAELIGLYQNRHAHLSEVLGREPTSAELADDMTISMQEVAEIRQQKLRRVTPKIVNTLKHELRRDLVAESEGGQAAAMEETGLRDRIVFLHGSLNPEQQLVLEHMFPDWGNQVIEDPVALAEKLNMSPQKVRAIRKQIGQKVNTLR
jgi:DNA-directed RNA polymerase specialized sigma subunit